MLGEADKLGVERVVDVAKAAGKIILGFDFGHPLYNFAEPGQNIRTMQGKDGGASAAEMSERANARYKEQLAAARAEAEATAAELEKVNAQLDQLAQQGAMPSDSADAGKLEALNAKLEKQQATVQQTTAEYKNQADAVDALNTKQTSLNDTLQKQQAAVEKQTELVNSLPASSGNMGQSVAGTTKRVSAASKAVGAFGKRLRGLAVGALVFNLISAALRAVVKEMGTALLKTSSVKKAFAQLKGSAATAAAGLANALAPAITWLINLVTTLLNAFIQLISTITGQSIGAMKKQGKAIAATGSAAKKATKSLAAFDEINRLDDKSGGADFSNVGNIGKISERMKELAEQFKAGFKKGFGDAGGGLEEHQGRPCQDRSHAERDLDRPRRQRCREAVHQHLCFCTG